MEDAAAAASYLLLPWTRETDGQKKRGAAAGFVWADLDLDSVCLAQISIYLCSSPIPIPIPISLKKNSNSNY